MFAFFTNLEDLPDQEQSTQILGRGSRARGVYCGIMFVLTESDEEDTILKRMTESTKFEFKDGADNLRLIRRMEKEVKKSGSKNKLIWSNFVQTVG